MFYKLNWKEVLIEPVVTPERRVKFLYIQDLFRFSRLSVGAAIVTIAPEFWGYTLTGSVDLLSDATESVVNLVVATVAIIVLKVIIRPADRDHEFGHPKAEYFLAGLKGAMIFVAMTAIIYVSIERLVNPQPVEQIGLGLIVTVIAPVINGVVALVLLKAGHQHNPVVLATDGKHLTTDVRTSAGALVGVALVWVTGLRWLDLIIALAVAVNILVTGYKLPRDSDNGLMDEAMEGDNRVAINEILASHRDWSRGIGVHEIHIRVLGHQQFIESRVLVPDAWSVEHGHDMFSMMEDELREHFPGVYTSSHLEPIEDERAYRDV